MEIRIRSCRRNKTENEYELTFELSIELIEAIKILSYSDKCVLTLVDNSNILDLKILYDSEMNDLFLTNSVEVYGISFKLHPSIITTIYSN